jgi:glycosyltransferase involved in cell wall biosynthesis
LTSDERSLLESNGWRLTHAHAFTTDPWVYRDYVQASRGEFTVAKDQNVRLRSGWFSERSACYLAAGRPVVTQDTGFGTVLPTGEGLFAFNTMEDIITAFEAIHADYDRHSRAARRIAEEYFRAETVLAKVLEDLGL